MKPLSERNKERKELYEKGLNDREIAEKQDVHKSSVKGWRDRRGLPPNAEPSESYNYRDVPDEEEIKKSILKSSNLKEVANSLDVCEEVLRRWMDGMDFPKTPRGRFSIPWVKISCNKEDVIETSKKYSVSETAGKYNTSRDTIRRFLKYHGINWNSNGSSNPPERRKMDPFLPIEGKYFRLKNSGCDYMIVKEEDKCILIEEKSSLSDFTLGEAVRQLMIAEKIAEDYFELTTQRKIIYCENPNFDSVEASKLRRTEEYLDIEIWGWND